MIIVNKLENDEWKPCVSCQKSNQDSDIYEVKIGKSERQTVTIRLCYECVCDLIGKMMLLTK